MSYSALAIAAMLAGVPYRTLAELHRDTDFINDGLCTIEVVILRRKGYL